MDWVLGGGKEEEGGGVYRGDMSKCDQELGDRDQGGGGKVRDGETNPVPVFTSLYHIHV